MFRGDGKQETVSGAYNHVLKYMGLFGGVQGITVLLSMVRNKFVSVLLGREGLGLIDMYNKAMDLLSNSTTLGLSLTAVRRLSELYEAGDEARLREQVRVVRSWSVLTALLGFMACLLFAPLLSRRLMHDPSYTVSMMLLSPLVAMLAITGAELAILKAVRQMKALATATTIGAVTTLLITVPLYYLFGMKGIVPALLASTLAVLLLNLHFSLKQFPWRANPFSLFTIRQGIDMLKLGLSFVLAGIIMAAAEATVRAFIVEGGGLADEGLYTAGFMLTVSYARIVMVSMDNDYYPRLSACVNDIKRRNSLINNQLEVCLLLIAPFLVLFVLCLPFLVRLLFTADFMTAIPMIMGAVFSMFFKAITTPVAYIPLARGDSVTYFVVELLYYIVFVVLLEFGYTHWGLLGAGVALTASNLFDLLMIAGIYHVKYHFRFSTRAIRVGLGQGLLLAAGLYFALQDNLWFKYGAGIPVFCVSAWWSLHLLLRETTFVSAIKARFSRFGKST